MSVRTFTGVILTATIQNLRTTSVTQTTIALAWDVYPGATGYEIRRNGTLVQTWNSGTQTTYTNSGHTAGTSYTYAVRPVVGGSGVASAQASIVVVTQGSSIIFTDPMQNFTQWSDVGGYWSIQSESGVSFARCAYPGSGTAGTQLIKALPVNPATGAAPMEYFIAFDMRQSVLSGTSKMLKFFGSGYGDGLVYSNNTWNAGYSGFYTGVMYGNSPSSVNDAQCVQRYFNDTDNDTRSAATRQVIYRRGTTLPTSTSWRRFYFHWKQNTVSPTPVGDGEVQVWLDSNDGNGRVLWLDVRGLFNHGDTNPGFESLSFGDYTSVSTPFNFDIRNVALSYSAMPS